MAQLITVWIRLFIAFGLSSVPRRAQVNFYLQFASQRTLHVHSGPKALAGRIDLLPADQI